MWKFTVRTILRNRIAISIIIALITCFLGYKATQVKMTYEMTRMLPVTDKNFIKYEEFKKIFGEDGNVIFIGFKDSLLFQLDHFKKFNEFCGEIEKLNGMHNILSVANIYGIQKNDSLKKFQLRPVIKEFPSTQSELDSLKSEIFKLKFYDGLLFNTKNDCYFIGVTLDKSILNNTGRITFVNELVELITKYEEDTQIKMHYSGLPYIRTRLSKMIKDELYLFIAISLLISALIITMFFRSFYVFISSFAIVAITVTWALGIIALFDYRISILIAVLPSLLIIIAIENSIFLINKFHQEYRSHGNKIKSLARVVSRIGFATFMTNATTAAGFASFIFTSNAMMKEFGIVSTINIMIEYVLSIVLTVIIYSFLPNPENKHLKHLDRKALGFIVDLIKGLIINHRKKIYLLGTIVICVCIYGVSLMEVSGKLVDDIPESNKIYKDLKFFEKAAGGVMPFEIMINTKEHKGVFSGNGKVVYKIKNLERLIKKDSLIADYFSKPLSISEAVCFVNQAYNNNNEKHYTVPPPNKLVTLSKMVNSSDTGSNSFKSFIDSNLQYTRVSFQIADVGTKEMNFILDRVYTKVDSIFPKEEYEVSITGNSVVFSKGTEFLIGNLWQSIIIGIVIISVLIALIFSSIRMIVIAMMVNLIPLLITAAIMGYFNIPIKPSTIIVFSVALGISIDNAILFLSRYRHELKKKQKSITESVLTAMDESAISMIYAAIVLILGFSIYLLSGFGGTQALGFLISVTLIVSIFFNILVLPSILLSLERFAITPAFEEPLIELDEEEEDNEEDDETDEEILTGHKPVN